MSKKTFKIAALTLGVFFCLLSLARASDQTVTITDKGFSPEEVNIQVGDTVTWVNQGKNTHWPASNFHPTHTLYPEDGGCLGSKLDACRGLKTGENFSFKFDQAGNWPMHDHLYPGLTMTVNVEGEASSWRSRFLSAVKNFLQKILYFFKSQSAEAAASRLQNNCHNPNLIVINYENCYAKEMRSIAARYGPDYALRVLFALQKIDVDAQGCHLIAHGIGWGTFQYSPKNWQKQVQTLYPGCSYGAVHGVIESYVSTLPDKRLSEDIVPIICGEKPRADCNHIVGHLVLVEAQGDIDKALGICEVFLDQRQRMHCETGVFMENETDLGLIEHGYVDSSWQNGPGRVPYLEKLCRSYEGEQGLACWTEISHVAAVAFKNDAKKFFDFCSTAPVSDSAKSCKRHGIGILTAALKFDLEKLPAMCKLPQNNDPTFESDCYLHITGSTLGSVPEQADKVLGFCKTLPNELQTYCFSQIAIANKNGAISANKLSQLCAGVTEFKDWCLGSKIPKVPPPQIHRGD